MSAKLNSFTTKISSTRLDSGCTQECSTLFSGGGQWWPGVPRPEGLTLAARPDEQHLQDEPKGEAEQQACHGGDVLPALLMAVLRHFPEVAVGEQDDHDPCCRAPAAVLTTMQQDMLCRHSGGCMACCRADSSAGNHSSSTRTGMGNQEPCLRPQTSAAAEGLEHTNARWSKETSNCPAQSYSYAAQQPTTQDSYSCAMHCKESARYRLHIAQSCRLQQCRQCSNQCPWCMAHNL